MVAAYNTSLGQLAATYDGAGLPTTIVDVYRLIREVHADVNAKLETFGLKQFDFSLYALDENDRPVATDITASSIRTRLPSSIRSTRRRPATAFSPPSPRRPCRPTGSPSAAATTIL